MTSWKVLFLKKAEKEFSKLDKKAQKSILKALSNLEKRPEMYLRPLYGPFSGFYKFRVGRFRLICKKENDQLLILIIKVAHRSKAYKKANLRA